jgi:hypothetical protein
LRQSKFSGLAQADHFPQGGESAMVAAMEKEAFFVRDGAAFRANPISAGPWDPSSLHGRVVIGLLAHAIESEHGDEAYAPARLTVDMYRLAGFAPITVETRVLRSSHRLKVIDAEAFAGGVSIARATSQLLRRTQPPAGRVWTGPHWSAPHPDDMPIPDDQPLALGGMWEMRPIAGTMGTVGPRRLWMAEVRELVAGVMLTPWVRAALAADFASPFANAGDAGLGYINSDITLYLARAPRGRWIGFEVVNHQADAGVAIGECWIYDEDGPIGTVNCCALAQKIMTGPAAGQPPE